MTIDELVSTLRLALGALTPVADKAGLGWHDENPHDDWERLAECLFDVFVRNPILADLELMRSTCPLPRYDYDISDYGDLSWIECIAPGRAEQLAFVRFLSAEEPFDTVQVVQLDPRTDEAGQRLSLPWASDLRFRLALRGAGGQVESVGTVRPVE